MVIACPPSRRAAIAAAEAVVGTNVCPIIGSDKLLVQRLTTDRQTDRQTDGRTIDKTRV